MRNRVASDSRIVWLIETSRVKTGPNNSVCERNARVHHTVFCRRMRTRISRFRAPDSSAMNESFIQVIGSDMPKLT